MKKGSLFRLKNTLKSNQGLTLVEVILALAIISILIIPLISYFVHGSKADAMSYERTEATYLAQTYMERVSQVCHELGSDKLAEELINTYNFTETNDFYEKSEDDFYINIRLNYLPDKEDLINVIIKIYSYENENQRLLAQMENILPR